VEIEIERILKVKYSLVEKMKMEIILFER